MLWSPPRWRWGAPNSTTSTSGAAIRDPVYLVLIAGVARGAGGDNQEHPVDKDSLAERGRAFEEDFFRKKDRDLIERVAAAQGTRTSSGPAPLTDSRALQELHDLGFTAETVALLPLMPAL